jgi:hypothetical protein
VIKPGNIHEKVVSQEKKRKKRYSVAITMRLPASAILAVRIGAETKY